MLSNNKWTRKNFEFLLKKYNHKQQIKKLNKLEHRRIAIIGSSPIALIVANIYSLYNVKITMFEKKQFGGAWHTKLINGQTYPCSTHILMPNKFTFDILNLLGVPSKKWSKRPRSLNLSNMNYELFPKNNNDYDKFLMNDFSFGNESLVQHLFKKINKDNIKIIKKKINQIEEYSDEIILFSGKNIYSFDYLFLTPAAEISFLNFKKK